MNDIEYLTTLPHEIVKKTLFNMPIKDILSLCSTDKYIQSVCKDDLFWKDYIYRTYNITATETAIWTESITLGLLSWKQIASGYIDGKPLLINDGNDNIEIISITPNMKLSDILDKFVNIFPNADRFDIYIDNPFNTAIDEDSYFIKYVKNGDFILYDALTRENEILVKNLRLNGNINLPIIKNNLYYTIYLIAKAQ